MNCSLDTAREIYSNITREKIALLNVLRDREMRLQHNHDSSEQFLQVSVSVGCIAPFTP